jgi:glutamine---fructose-6-phosphate transaminase (isomerizing)
MKISSILESEIFQQPEIVRELIEKEQEHTHRIADEIKGRFRYIVIAARGTSDNAARYAQYLFGAQNHVQVALATPSLFTIYHSPPDLSEALVIGISQSGQSPDIVHVLVEAKRQNRPTLALTNDPASPLASSADFVIPLHASVEKAVAATKTYTSSLAALALLSGWLENDLDRIQQLERIPELLKLTLEGLHSTIHHVERYRYMEHCIVLGRGYNYCTAFEIALKVKELTRIVAEPYSSADFRHGPIATIHEGFPVILIAPTGKVSSDSRELITHLNSLKAELLIISDDPEILSFANLPLEIPAGLPEWLSPLAAVIPGQLFAKQLTIERGLNPDNPAGLKKVTETY